MKRYVPQITWQTVEEPTVKIETPEKSFQVLKEFYDKLTWENPNQEIVSVIGLNNQNEVVEKWVVSIGTINSCLIDPSIVFRKLIVSGCKSFIMAHNHPSGTLIPSMADIKITQELINVGKTIKIEMLDHIILGNGFYSFRESNEQMFN